MMFPSWLRLAAKPTINCLVVSCAVNVGFSNLQEIH